MNKYSRVLEWVNDNGLSVEFTPRKDGTMYCVLRNLNDVLEVKDGPVLIGLYGDGYTFEEAFEDMVYKYSGKLLISDILRRNGGKGEYQFPIIIE